MIREKLVESDDAGTDSAVAVTGEYVAPSMSRLGTLGELTLGGPGAFDDGYGGGWNGSFLPP